MKHNSILIISLVVIVAAAAVYMNHLARRMAQEESQRVSIWAEATERVIQAGEGDDIDFYIDIIERNTSIPVYMADSAGNILLSRNAKRSVRNVTKLHGPIEVRIDDNNIQYIYYDDSDLLFQLRFFPLVMFTLIVVFIIAVIIVLYTTERAEQNRVWVGLSKETAHQLGTPISSLNGWVELLKTNYPDDAMIPEIQKDVDRLEIIADRFSKVGSIPELKTENLDTIVRHSADYMQTRLGKRIRIDYPHPLQSTPFHTSLSAPLFSWVLENLIKNAVDAGATHIHILLTEEGEMFQLDITDNGNGIPGRNTNRIFNPGYTTKKRGWGLGLSLAKRIIEQYHHGHLQLLLTTPLDTKNPEAPHGTTFRILLKRV